MREQRFSEEHIIGILKEWEGGLPIGELAREHGVCDNTLYRWKSKYGGMEASDAKRLKSLEDENRRRSVPLWAMRQSAMQYPATFWTLIGNGPVNGGRSQPSHLTFFMHQNGVEIRTDSSEI